MIGCASKKECRSMEQTYKTSNHVELCSADKFNMAKRRLNHYNIQPQFMGDQILITIPAKKLFNERSTTLNHSSKKQLDAVALFLSCYKKISITITGYTDYLPYKKANIELSELQSKQVLDYLDTKKINARLISAAGKGEVKTCKNILGAHRIDIAANRLP